MANLLHVKTDGGIVHVYLWQNNVLCNFKQTYMQHKITDFLDDQCMLFWNKFSNNTLPNYFRSMFQYNSILYDFETTFECMYLQPERLIHVTSCDTHN